MCYFWGFKTVRNTSTTVFFFLGVEELDTFRNLSQVSSIPTSGCKQVDSFERANLCPKFFF